MDGGFSKTELDAAPSGNLGIHRPAPTGNQSQTTEVGWVHVSANLGMTGTIWCGGDAVNGAQQVYDHKDFSLLATGNDRDYLRLAPNSTWFSVTVTAVGDVGGWSFEPKAKQ